VIPILTPLNPSSHQFENEIACIDIATVASRIVAAVGLWTVQTVLIIAIPTLEILSTQVIESDYLIRSVLITTFADGVTQLFAGLGDGALTSFIVDAPQSKIVAETSKTVTLGTRPIVMCGFEANGVVSIFVSSDRPTVISRTSDKLVYSSVNLKVRPSRSSFRSLADRSAEHQCCRRL
jgi:DNA damage-binding protein 1